MTSHLNLADPHRSEVTGPRVGDLSAVVAVLDVWRADYRVMFRRDPMSGVTATLRACLADLESALAAARTAQVYATVEDVHRLTGRPPSTIRRICKSRGIAVGARKVEGEWMIHLPTFEKQLGQSPAVAGATAPAHPEEASA